MQDRKRFVQIASRVADAVASLKHGRCSELARQLESLVGHIERLDTESRKMSVALRRNWLAAADRCLTRARNALNDLSYSISRVQKLTATPRRKTPTLSLIVDELRQLEDEFGGVEFEKADNSLSVTTESITLEDVALGPFRIQLELDRLGELYYSNPYRVIALDPNPAASDSAVTHPHVSGEKLCEGEGCAAIRAAIEEGRICDFFTLVRSILNTYSADSPYVALHEWSGASCYDCGYTMNSEDCYYCEHCQHDYCSDCSGYCHSCDRSVCLGCGGPCSNCEEFVCSSCIGKCDQCEKVFCKSCLEESLCQDCREEMENEDEPEEPEINECQSADQPQTQVPQIRLAG